MAKASAIATARKWTVDELARNIHRINIDLNHVGDEQRVLLMSDVHWDNPKCNREKLIAHLEEAKAYNAPVIDNGDFFCAMQGKWDGRANKSDLRPEHQTSLYLDSLIDTACEFWKPYLHLLTVRGQGNHETAIIKRHETDLTQRLTERLRAAGASDVKLGGYSGWVVFQTNYRGRIKPIKLHYHHGHGGGGPVTRGVIQTNRQAVYLADADIVFTGHTHDAWQVPIARVRLNADNTLVEHTRQTHVRVAGYKEEYGDGYGGWHVERGGPPKPVGSAWLILRLLGSNGNSRFPYVDYDIVEAK